MYCKLLRPFFLVIVLAGLLLPVFEAGAAQLERAERDLSSLGRGAAPGGVVAMFLELLDSLGLVAAPADLGPTIDPTGVGGDSTEPTGSQLSNSSTSTEEPAPAAQP